MNKLNPRLVFDELIKEHGESYASVSRLLGRNSAYVQQFIKRGSPSTLDENDIVQLALYFGVSLKTLGGREHPDKANSFVKIPVIGGKRRKGSPEHGRLVDEAWLNRMGYNPAGVAIIIVEGDAMQPTLKKGDEIFIQRHLEKESLRDGLYAIRGTSEIMIRRIALEHRKNRISLLTDHPAFPSWDGLMRNSVDVVGRVFWMGIQYT